MLLRPSHMALRWSAKSVEDEGYKHLAAPRPNPAKTTTIAHYITSKDPETKAG